jgi:hypothetical protein
MLILLIIFLVLLVLLTFLLVTPLVLEIDSESSRPLNLRWWGVAGFSVVLEEEEFAGELRIFGFKRRISFTGRKRKKAKAKVAKPHPEKPKRKRRFTLRMVRNLLGSFKVRQLEWELDTGNFVLNGQLYSVLWMFQRPHMQVSINFLGRNRLKLVVDNRLIRLAWAFLKR